MNHSKSQKILKSVCYGVACFCLLAYSAIGVRAQLKASQARKLITRMAGVELTSGSVRVKSVSPGSATTAEANAEIRTVWKLAQDTKGVWRVAELRTAPARWEEVSLIGKALNASSTTSDCNVSDPPFRGRALIDPSVRRVRCLLGSLLGIEVPSDAIRIQQVTPSAMPLASQASALVVAWVRVDARFVNNSGTGWRVADLRTGTRNWLNLDNLVAALNHHKQQKAQAELQTIAMALEKFRADRGFYVVADDQAVAIDHLSPRYLATIIRIDPWNRPYKYQGERERFTLRSAGPDGKDNTADDLVVSN
ncbi:MAG TPA: type II secretion system protein GspG [Pyrinomonadaceae bacterium]|nr:type II secretion system protein GspG [Pyrinomonadaceae bacterium]